jgi:hypothetical protein
MTNLAFPPLPATAESDDQLGERITLLAGQINAANHRLLKLIAEFDRRKGWSGGEGAGEATGERAATGLLPGRRRHVGD